MEGQGRPPQHRPDVVAVAAVGELMGEHVAQHRRILRRRGGQVHRRAGEAIQAGGGQPPGHIYRNGQPRNWMGPPHPPQAEVEPQVGDHQRGGHSRRTRQPHGGEHPLPGDGLRRGGRLDRLPLPRRLRRGGGLDGIRLPVPRRFGWLRLHAAAVNRGGGGDGALAHLHLRPGQVVEHAQARLGHRAGDEQAHQHHQPQGVLQPQGQLPPEDPAHQQDDENQQGRRDDPLSHGGSPPVPSKCRRGRPAPPGSAPRAGRRRS